LIDTTGEAYAITTLIERRSTGEVIAFVCSDYKKPVALGNAVLGQAREEFSEGFVVRPN
jgi:hypothetical protein